MKNLDRKALKLLIQKLKEDGRNKNKLFSWPLKFNFLLNVMKLIFAKKAIVNSQEEHIL